MAKRSTVSKEISKGIIWINSTDFNASVKAVQIHEILRDDIGYQDGVTLEQSDTGMGISLTLCSSDTIKEMAENYMYAKRLQNQTEPTPEQVNLAIEHLDTLYDNWRETDKYFLRS